MFLLHLKVIQLVTYFTVFTIILITIQLFYWYYFFNGLSKLQVKDSPKSATEPVSVVICARNAEKELELNLPSILEQNHPNYEVLIVDDDSEDNTADLLNRMQKKERYLNWYKIIKKYTGKKEALKTGIVKSRHSWLLFTDADCTPSSEYWIHQMYQQAISENSKIVLGYSPYKNDGSSLNHWIHYEAWVTGLQYLSYALKGLPYMGVGRNVLYHKSLISPTIIDKHKDLSSGDDDLTINQIANKDNCSILIDKSSFVESNPSPSWNAYFRQKTRHFSTAHRYQFIHQVLLTAYSLSQIGFYLCLFVLLFFQQYTFALSFYVIRLLLLLPTVIPLMKKLNASFKLWMFPILDFGQSIFYIIFSVSVLFPQKNKW